MKKKELLERIEALEAINTKRGEVTSMLSASEPKHQYKEGDKVIVVGERTTHDYKYGQVLEVYRVDNTKEGYVYLCSEDPNNGFCPVEEMCIQPYTAPKEEEIVVPDSIVFETTSGFGDSLGIVFNEGKQSLYYDGEGGVYSVYPSEEDDSAKGSNFKLIKIDPKDREVGYTYFFDEFLFGDNMHHKGDDLHNYCKYLGGNKFAHVVNGEEVGVGCNTTKHWYKVVRR